MRKNNYTNAQLAEALGIKHVSSLYKIAERFYWDRTRMPYGRGWIWHISEQDLKDYFDEVSGKRESLGEQIAAAIRVSSALDMMHRGKILARGLQDLPMLRPSYIHGEGQEPVNRKQRPKPLFYYAKDGRLRATSEEVEASVRALILKCLRNDIYSVKVILEKLEYARLAVHVPSGDRLLADTIKRITKDIAEANGIDVTSKQTIIKRLHAQGLSLRTITKQLGASYNYVFACVRKVKAVEYWEN